MRRIFISDLHLGDKSRTDDFVQDVPFLHFLRYVRRSRVDELYIVGDFLELWQSHFQSVVFAHKEVIGLLNRLKDFGTKVFYIYGNHDYLMRIFDKCPIFFNDIMKEVKIGNLIWAEHGSEYDQYNRGKRPIGMKAAKFAGYCERLFGEDADEKLLGFVEKIEKEGKKLMNMKTPASRDYEGDLSEYEEAASDLIKKKRVKIAIFGHTHRELIKNLSNGGIYCNTGTWCGRKSTYIEIRGRQIYLRSWREKNKTIKKVGF